MKNLLKFDLVGGESVQTFRQCVLMIIECLKEPKSLIQYMAGFILVFFLSLTAYAQPQGVINTLDYGDNLTSGGMHCWRGYAFKLEQDTTVTHIIGGPDGDGIGSFEGAIYAATTNASGVPTGTGTLLASVTFPTTPVSASERGRVAVALSSNLHLSANTWYVVAQGRVSGNPLHYFVDTLNVPDLIASSFRIQDWQPQNNNAFQIGSCNTTAAGNANASFSSTPVKVAVGFGYLTTATLPVIETLDQPLSGRLTDRGNAPVALSMEYSTSSDMSDLTVVLDQSGYEGGVPYTFSSSLAGLTPNTRYYYRARALNDAGQAVGAIKFFDTPPPPTAPTITSIDPGNGQLTVNFTHSGNKNNIQYSLNNGAWISRSPASVDSPLLITGLNNGTSYSVRLRVVYQGIEGDISSPQSSTPTAIQTGIGGTLTPTTIQYGNTATVTGTGGQSSGGYEFRQNGGTGDVSFSGSGSSRTIVTVQSGTAVIQVRKLGDGSWTTSDWVTVGTLTVTQAPLTVTADNQSKIYGDAEPTPLTYTASGTLYHGDGYNVISGVSLSAPTGADATAGTHTITASGGTATNYSITHVNGTLTVSQRPLTGSFTVTDPKIYDDTTLAHVTNRSLSNLATLDSQDENGVFLDGGVANFDTKAVGTDKEVTLTGMTLSGDRSANYVLETMNTTTADIVPDEPAEIIIVIQPGETVAGQKVEGPPEVEVRDQWANPVLAGISVEVLPASLLTASSTRVVDTDANGRARFENLVIEEAGQGHQIIFQTIEPIR